LVIKSQLGKQMLAYKFQLRQETRDTPFQSHLVKTLFSFNHVTVVFV